MCYLAMRSGNFKSLHDNAGDDKDAAAHAGNTALGAVVAEIADNLGFIMR